MEPGATISIKKIDSLSSQREVLETEQKTEFPDSLNVKFREGRIIWKKFIEWNVQLIINEVLTTRKVKYGTYKIIIIEYEIGVDGRVTTNSIICDPQSEILVEKTKLMMTKAPLVFPRIHSDGSPRVTKLKQTLTLSKERDR